MAALTGGWAGGWSGGWWLIFLTEYVITKSHAKNQLIWTKNGREMAVLSFPAFFGWGGAPRTPKMAGKLQTAISRPFLVRMSWFFAWDFVITYSVRKISHQPPDQPPAQPPVRAATRPTTFRRKLSDSADICRVGWQSYNSASYKKLALTELKQPRNRPANTIYSLRRALSRPFWFGLG